jgi:hypothetical protein
VTVEKEFFMKHVFAFFILFCILSVSAHASTLYPLPTTWSLGNLASWAQPLIKTTDTTPAIAVASSGDILIIVGSGTIAHEAFMILASGTRWLPITIPDASATRTGKISTDTQSISGNKTLIGSSTIHGNILATGTITASDTIKAGGFIASDSSPGITGSYEFPFVLNESSATITIKGGIITGVQLP